LHSSFVYVGKRMPAPSVDGQAHFEIARGFERPACEISPTLVNFWLEFPRSSLCKLLPAERESDSLATWLGQREQHVDPAKGTSRCLVCRYRSSRRSPDFCATSPCQPRRCRAPGRVHSQPDDS